MTHAAADAPALAAGLAEVFALELDQQLRAALAAWPRLRAGAERADACRELTRIFHTIKGGAALVGRGELATAARALEHFFADPAAAAPPQAALDALCAAASLPAPRLDVAHRALLAPAAEPPPAADLVPVACGATWLALRLEALSHAALRGAPAAAPPLGDGDGDGDAVLHLADALAAPRPGGRRVALALVGGPTLLVERVRAPLRLAVAAPHRLLALHPWLSGTAIDACGRPLPVIDVPRLRLHLGPTEAELPGTTRVTSGAVLVVDDSLVAREAAAAALRAAGAVVDLAHDGREALAKLERAAYAVVLSDLEMPQLDGFGLLACLRASQRLRQMPVVVCSSRLDAEARRRLAPLGVAACVDKPFTAAELVVALAPWLPQADAKF